MSEMSRFLNACAVGAACAFLGLQSASDHGAHVPPWLWFICVTVAAFSERSLYRRRRRSDDEPAGSSMRR